MLLSKPLTKDSFYYELYTDDTFNHAKKLTDQLYTAHSPHINNKFVSLRTDIRHREFTIVINTRQLVKIYNLDKYRNIRLIDLMGPVTKKGYFDQDLKCISEEIQLIEIYHTLYSPSKISLWEDYLIAENDLYNSIKHIVSKKATTTLTEGGNDDSKASSKAKWKSHIDGIIIDKIIRNTSNVIIGDYALANINSFKSDCENLSSRLQIITSDEIEVISSKIEKALKASKQQSTISFIKYSLNLPTDFQIIKWTIYLTTDKNQTPIMDVFNSSSFELIPYINGSGPTTGIKYGNLFVLLRFKFIDLWVLRLILNIGSDNEKFIKSKIGEILNQIRLIRDYVDIKSKEDLFQLSDYAGVYINETVAKKKLITERGERFPPYYPAKQKNQQEPN
jgi:hypothetical protein